MKYLCWWKHWASAGLEEDLTYQWTQDQGPGILWDDREWIPTTSGLSLRPRGGWRVASGLVGGAAVQALRCPAGSRGLWTQRELLLEVQRETAGTSKGDFHLAGALQSASCWRITNLIILLKGMSFFYKRNCTYVLNALLSARDRRQGPKGMLFFKEDKELQYFTSMDINLGAVGERKDVLGLREQDQNKT